MRNLEVTYVPAGSLHPAARNARTHTPKQIGQIADSLKAFGWTNPILTNDNGSVIAGHGRLEAAKLLGMKEVPIIRLSQLSPDQCRLYALADNRLAERAGWDRDLLALELGELTRLDLDLNVEITGFDMAEIDILLAEENADASDTVPDIDTSRPAVSRLGDLWLLDRHRLLCGNSLMESSFEFLLKGKVADLVFSDPPYNVPIRGHVSGMGKVQHREFEMASGEMSESEFTEFLMQAFRLMKKFSKDGAIHFQCIDWRHLYEMLNAGREVGWTLKNICVWAKDNGGMGSLYRSRHELVCVFKSGSAPHVNNVELGRFGRNRTNVWEYRGMNCIGNGRDEKLALHPTVKPVALIADAILDCSNRGGLVLDAFLGSGTTVIAAERTGRRCTGIELDPHYIDVAIRRWEKITNRAAVLEASGQTFLEVEAQRISGNGGDL